MDKISYALGLSIGNNFQNSGINNLQVEDFVKGLKDVLSEAQPEISYDEAKQVINDYFMNLQKERLELNKKAGEEFLNINKGKAGVVTLPSGLQYQVLKQGEGAKCVTNLIHSFSFQLIMNYKCNAFNHINTKQEDFFM